MEAFFTVKSKDIRDKQFIFNVALNPNHPVYQGHFPQKPVAPGVMLTGMIKRLLEMEYGRNLKLIEARNIKFLKMMLPEEADHVRIEINIKDEGKIGVKASASIEEAVYFKISASFV